MKLRNILMIIFAIMLVFSFTACGTGETNTDNSDNGFEGDSFDVSNEPTETACNHSWAEWTIAKETTCSTKGLETRFCVKCNTSEEREIETIAHTPGEWQTEEGERYRLCEVCGTKVDSEKIKVNLEAEYNSDVAGYYSTYNGIVDKSGKETYHFAKDEKLHVYGNGYFISSKNDIYYLKDYSGEMITSSKALGATGFGLTHGYTSDVAFLSDGYVFVYKVNESYTGTTYEIGIINTKGEWVVPLSDKNPLLSCGMFCSVDVFQNNKILPDIIYAGDGCLIVEVNKDDYRYDQAVYNIELNKILYYETDQYYSNMDYMITEIEFENGVSRNNYGNFMYEFHTDGTVKITKGTYGSYGFFFDQNGTVYSMGSDGWGAVLWRSDGTVIKDFEDNNINVFNVSNIGNGTWLVSIVNAENSCYYGIVNTKGEFIFEPIKTDAQYICLENGASISTTSEYGWQESGKKIVINEKGEVLYESRRKNTEIYIKNGIVLETDKTDTYIYSRLPS